VKTASYQVASVTELSTHGGRRAETIESSAAAGAAWGTLIHALFEQLGRQPEMTPNDLIEFARWHCRENDELLSVVSSAVETIESIRNSTFWREVQQATVRLTEVPFSIRLSEGPPSTLLSSCIERNAAGISSITKPIN
jgi:hypothetical protein